MKPSKQPMRNGPIYTILIIMCLLVWWLVIHAAMLIGEAVVESIKPRTTGETRPAVVDVGGQHAQK